MSTHRLFVYGTLRKGQHANSLLENSTFIDTVELPKSKGLVMLDLGPYPGLLYASDINFNSAYPVVGDIYDVDDITYNNIERYEGYPYLYTRASVKHDKHGDVQFYYYLLDTNRLRRVNHRLNLVKTGDWLKHIGERNG